MDVMWRRISVYMRWTGQIDEADMNKVERETASVAYKI